jgi:hypothetical protein
MEKEVILSDGKPCTIRVLGLFELDDVAPVNPPGHFYEQLTGVEGKTVPRLYVPPNVPPDEPKQPRSEAKEGTQLFEGWLEYDTYQLYLDHRRNEAEIVNRYAQESKIEIMRLCVAKEDQKRVATIEDWRTVHTTALSAQLTQEDIAAVLRVNFQSEILRPGSLGDNAG